MNATQIARTIAWLAALGLVVIVGTKVLTSTAAKASAAL